MSSPLKRELDGVLRPQKIPGLQAGEDVKEDCQSQSSLLLHFFVGEERHQFAQANRLDP